jgi:hypothetical protein
MARGNLPALPRGWLPNLQHFSRYSHYQDCLAVIWQNVGSSGLERDELLLPYQQRIFGDLEDGIDEGALERLYDWWDYDLKRLYERAPRYRPNEPAKPRINLWMERTSKGNFKCEWWPVGFDSQGNRYSPEPPDWSYWFRFDNRHGGWDSRPSNELIFIHDIDYALTTIRLPDHDPRPISQLDAVLLKGVAELVSSLRARLERHFEVTMLRDVFVAWDPRKSGIFDGPDRMLKWEIDDPKRRENEAELAELGAIKEKLGFTEAHFEHLWSACLAKKASGPPPLPDNIAPKVAKALREEGLRDITARETKRVRYLIDKHRPKRVSGSAEVIKFSGRTDGEPPC